jgi:sugar lactone lactonase YvrE
VKIDVNTNPATVELLVDGLVAPSGVKFNSQGELYGVDSHTGDLFHVDIDTGAIDLVAHVMEGITNLAFDSQDRLFVCQYQDGDVFQVLPSGEIKTILPGGLIYPGGVAAMLRGNGEHVFVADFWTIKDFEAATGEMSNAHRNMDIGADLTTAITISADGDNLIASTWVANMVYVLDAETGGVIDKYTMASWLPMDAMRFMGEIIFTDLGTGTVKKVDNTTIASGFYVPTGLAAIGDDLYVADWASGMVWKVYDDGNPTMVPVATDLAQPEGLTDDIDGNLLVVETGAGRLSRIDTETGEVSLVADDLALGYPAAPGFPPTYVFNGVDVGPSGNIYVTGDIDNVLYCIKATKRVISTVDDLPGEVFRSGRYQRIFKKFIGVSQNLIDKGKYRSARAMMEFLRRRTDGTGKDWIVNPAAQEAMMDLLDMQISSLTEKIEG